MPFETLLGNEQLKQNLARSVEMGRLSHFYLISGPAGSGKRTLAKWLVGAMECTGAPCPCGVCPACRKVLEGVHPDVITLDNPEKKTVSVDLVRQARTDVYLRPNEGKRKIYIFPRAGDLGLPAQNALLKVLEEPPRFGTFLLLAENPDQLLPTVRSRCVELRLTALPEEVLLSALRQRFPQTAEENLKAAAVRGGGFLGAAAEILEKNQARSPKTLSFGEAFARRDALGLLQTLAPLEKTKRDPFGALLEEWIALLTEALEARCGAPGADPLANQLGAARTGGDLAAAIGALRRAADGVKANGSVGAACGYLVWALQGNL